MDGRGKTVNFREIPLSRSNARKRTRAKSSSCRLPLLLSLVSSALRFFPALTARHASKMAPTSTLRGALLCQGGSVGRMWSRTFALTAGGAYTDLSSSTVWLYGLLKKLRSTRL